MSASPALTFPCWIDAFTNAARGLGIPPAYVEWAGIFTIGSILGRHVYSMNAKGTTFANLYIFMVGPPATGKSEVEDLIKPFLVDMGAHISAEHVSKASLIDELSKAHVKKITKDMLVDYHNLTLVTSEFIQTFPDYDVRFLGMLARWWDCPSSIREAKRHLKEPIVIPSVCCNIMAGVQPGILAHAFPAEAWNGGFLSRTICVYVPTPIELLLYSTQGATKKLAGKKLDTKIYSALVKDLTKIGSMMGQMVQDETYIEAYLAWRSSNREPHPKHPKLTYYNLRREHNLEKLSIISAASRGSMTLTAHDYARARSWLEGAESNIEDIFAEMGNGDDQTLMQDLHAYIVRMAQGTNKPIRESIVRRFLTSKIPSQRMQSFLEVAESAGFIEVQQTGGGFRTISAKPSV